MSDPHRQTKMKLLIVLIILFLILSVALGAYKFIYATRVFIDVNDVGRIPAIEFEWENKTCLGIHGMGLVCV